MTLLKQLLPSALLLRPPGTVAHRPPATLESPPPTVADSVVVMVAIVGSMMNTFIKPVVYAEVGFADRHHGKIEDPLEGVGFFGRPETLLVLIVGGCTGLIWASVIIIAVATNLSAIERIVYLRRRLGDS